MPYGTIYRLIADTMEWGQVQLNICDRETFDPGATTTYSDLVGTDRPIVVSLVDNDRDKFKPIRAKKLDINLKSDELITAKTFASGEDNRWYVEVFVVDTGYVLFNGHLVMDDFEQPLLPMGLYGYRLTAIDGLGTLKEPALTKPDGTNPRGKYKAIEFIAWCLQKTGLQLDILVTDTWIERNQNELATWYDFIYFDAKTFEKNIGECVDCYKALEMLFRYNCSIQQINGKWWISHTDERSQNKTYRFRFDYQGTFIEMQPAETYRQTLGDADYDLMLANKNGLINYIRPHKSVKLTYNYEYPKEIIDNIDFSRGAIYTPLSMPSYTTYYHIDDWSYQTYLGGTPSSLAYIKRTFQDTNSTYEKERYVVMTPTSETGQMFIISNPVPLGYKDKFTVSFDRRLSRDVFTRDNTTEQWAQVRLYGSDGSYWTLQNFDANDGFLKEGNWVKSNSSFNVSAQYLVQRYDRTYNEGDWDSLSVTCSPVPVSGEIRVCLLRCVRSEGYTVAETHYTNLQFDYIPFINGDYSKYSGQSHKVTQDGEYKARIEDTVQIGDAPRPLMKGAMFRKVGSNYVLADWWLASGDIINQTFSIPPVGDYYHPFGQLQIFAVWNQYNRRMIQFTGSVKGMKLDGDLADMHHNYKIDKSETCKNKFFMPTSFSQDYVSDRWNVTLVETVDETIWKDYASTHEFKYES